MDDVSADLDLFGREDTLEVIDELLDRGGSTVLVGDPGVGKSSLLRIAAQRADHRGRRVLSVTPTAFDRGMPFAGLTELISQCPPEAEAGLPAPQRRALEIALHRVDPDGSESDPLAVPLAVRGLLTQLCALEPVALIIDDLQWLDPASVGSLAFALRSLAVEPQRLAVLIGTRPEGADNDLTRAVPEPRQAHPLEPLEDSAIGQLLRHRLGPRWTPPMSAGVARASTGNPFLALMIAQAMESDVSRWRWSAQDGHNPVFPVPPSLVGLLGEKVRLLPDGAREVLLLVSAAGRLTLGQLAQIAAEGPVRSALEAAADWDVATVGPESIVAFTHPLLASAIYDAATPADRRRAHHTLSEELEDPVERARHRSKSMVAPDEATAIELDRAAEISRSRGAQQLAGELLEGAALATPAGTDNAARLSRWLRAVDTYLAAGDGVAAQVALDRCSALASTDENQAQVLLRRIRMVDHYEGVRALAEDAVRLAPKGTEVRVEILSSLGMLHRMQGHGDEALQFSRMAVAEAVEVDRLDLQLAALNNLLSVEWHWATGDPTRTARDIDLLVESAGLDPKSMPVVWTKGFFATWDDERAEAKVRDGIAAAVASGRYGDLSYLYICLVLILIRSSRVTDARAALDYSDRLGAWAGSTFQEDMARSLVESHSGDLDSARELALGAAARSRTSGSTYWLAGFIAQVAFIETSARNWQQALDAARELAEIFAATKMVDLEQLLWAVDYAEAATQLGNLDEAEAAIAILRRQADSGRPEASVAADRCQAMLSAARGNLDGALIELQRIVDLIGAECSFEALRSKLALGQVYRRAKRKGMAHQTLNAVAVAFADLGMPRWAERAREEAERVGLHPTESGLTATENRVAEQVGSGQSNAETAAALFMSVKTVEANLTRIYRKLGVRSRSELVIRLKMIDTAQPHR